MGNCVSKKYIPREYQNLITDFEIEHDRCNIFAGMGLGKTVSTLTALERLYLAGEETQPTLVLAPLRVAQSTWPDEAKKWDHLRNIEVQPIIGTKDQRVVALNNKNASVFTINYENLPWLVDYFKHNPRPWPFGTIIADESTKLKGFRSRQGTARAKAIASVSHTKVRRWVNLTGTPAPNGLKDLWGQQWFVDGGSRLGRTYTAFSQRWFRKSYDGFGLDALPHAQGDIQDAIADCSLSLDAKDWFDIKDPIKNVIDVHLPHKAMQQYRDMEKKMFLELESALGPTEVEALNAAAKTQKCLQLANGAIYTDDAHNWEEIHDSKIQALEDIIEESMGASVLVAYHFKHDLARLQAAFPRGRKLDSNPATITDWNAGKIPILFAHPASAGHGLNLQDGGNIMVFFSVNWNLEEHQQIIERIGPTRQMQAGHDRPVFIHYILAHGTLDYDVLDRLESKRSVQDSLLNAMKRRK
jgi:SNF2 family DNA or RNA helicase